MTEKRKSPALRFRGYTDDWEQRKFSELYARSSEKNDGSIGMDKNITVATMQFKNDVKVSTTEYLKTYYTFKLGDIAFEGHQSKEFRYGRFVENDIGNGIVSHIFAVFRPIQEYDLCFWKYAINNETLMQRILARSTKASTMMHDLVTNDFLKETFLVPSVKEQKQIGAFLNKLDHLITLHQRKLEKLKLVKKSMLEKMFPKNGSSVPEIRFKGFTDDWEQRKFNDIATRESAVRKSSPDCPSIEYEDVVAEAGILNKDIRLKDSEKNGIIFDGSQVLYGKLRPYLHNWHNPDFEGVAVGDWWVLKPIHVDKSFLYRLIQTQKFDDIANQSSGSKMPRADWNLVSNSEFSIPPLIDEQVRIGTYFNDLDNLITLHQRKLEKLKLVKKSMLEKMFPKNGSSVPEIRFKGFTDDWEQRKLIDEVASIDTGKSNFTPQESGQYEILGSTSVIGYDDTYDYEGDFLLTARVGANAGELYRYSGKVKISDNTVFIKGEQLDFVYYALLHFDIKRLSFGTGQPLVKASELKVQEIMMPVEDTERTVIGEYFANLDNLITLHQRKVEKLKILKKSMLEKMFV